MKFEIFMGKNEQYYFRLRDKDNNIVLTSEGYTTKTACENGIESVKKNSIDEGRFVQKTTESGKFYFNIKAGNGQIVGDSKYYESQEARAAGQALVMQIASQAEVNDLTV